jgi:hypothetical protein
MGLTTLPRPAQRIQGDDFRLLESSGEAVNIVRPLGEENQLQVDCLTSPDGPIVLRLAVNGQALARVEDERGRRGFDGFGLFVDTTEDGAEALFDDVVVTELVPRYERTAAADCILNERGHLADPCGAA